MADKLYELTAHELNKKIADKEISATEAAQSYIQRINDVDGKVKSYVTTTPELTLEQAKAVDEAIARGEKIGPLTGVPGAIKDNMSTRGILTTCSSKILDNYKPVYKSLNLGQRKFRQAGSQILYPFF